MNKKVLSAILFSALFAGTGTFTSCIDNDEPAGIEELRGAKATLLAAKAKVAEADAQLVLAKAKIKEAIAKQEEAKAEWEQANAEIKRLEAELKAEENKQMVAEYQHKIDSLKNATEQAALIHQTQMLQAKQNYATVKRSYEMALAAIEIAKELFPTAESMSLNALQTVVDTKKGAYDTAYGEWLAASETLADAAALYGAVEAIDKDSLELELSKLENTLAENTATLATLEGFLAEDLATKDWREEIDSLNALVDELKKDSAVLALNKVKAEQSEAYEALKQDSIDAEKVLNVDSVYKYSYYSKHTAVAEEAPRTLYANNGVVGLEVLAAEDSVKAVETSLSSALTYLGEKNEATGEIEGGIIEDYKQFLAKFTKEKKSLLDSLAAADAADTTYQHRADTTIANWKAALAAYKNVNTDDEDLKDAAEQARPAAFVYPTSKAADYTAFRTALNKYYEAAKANGATFNKVPVQTKGSVTVAGNTHPTSVTELKDWSDALTDANVMFLDSLGFDFFGVDTEAGKPTTDTIKYADANANPAALPYFKAIFNKAPKTATTLKTELETASLEAFGPAEMYLTGKYANDALVNTKDGNYLLYQPDTADVKNIFKYVYGEDNDVLVDNYSTYKYGQFGAYGQNMLIQDQAVVTYAKNYKDLIKNYEDAIVYWTDKFEIMNNRAIERSNKMKDAHKALVAYRKANFGSVETEINAIHNHIERTNRIILALNQATDVYFPEDITGSYVGEEEFKTVLQGLIDSAKLEVIKAEKTVALFKYYMDGGDEFDSYQLAVETEKLKKETLDKAEAELKEATDNLKKALEIFEATIAE